MKDDMEKVIKGLEKCLADESCDECPYEENCFDPDIDNPWGTYVMRDALALLKEQPQVVRCKDCKHGGCRTQKLDGSIFRVVCKKHGTKKNELWMDADWFCADGERKE